MLKDVEIETMEVEEEEEDEEVMMGTGVDMGVIGEDIVITKMTIEEAMVTIMTEEAMAIEEGVMIITEVDIMTTKGEATIITMIGGIEEETTTEEEIDNMTMVAMEAVVATEAEAEEDTEVVEINQEAMQILV